MRSLATRSAVRDLPLSTPDIINVCIAAGFDLVIVETPGVDLYLGAHDLYSLYVFLKLEIVIVITKYAFYLLRNWTEGI